MTKSKRTKLWHNDNGKTSRDLNQYNKTLENLYEPLSVPRNSFKISENHKRLWKIFESSTPPNKF